MLGLEYFSFSDLWSPRFMVFMMAVTVLYTFVVGPWRKRFGGEEPVSWTRQLSFISAMLLLYLTHGGPLSLLGHLMFSFHMTNMAIAYMIVPSMILYGIPDWFWRWAFGGKAWRPFRVLMNPMVCLALFILLFSMYHIPTNHDLIMVHFTLHRIYYVVLFITSMMLWWHIYLPVPEWRRMTPLMTLLYIFMGGLLLTPACVMIIFSGTPLFSVYNDPQVWVQAMGYCVAGDPSELLARFNGPSFFNLLDPYEDQQLGGIIMKLVQELINVSALYSVFMFWYRKEKSRDEDSFPESVNIVK